MSSVLVAVVPDYLEAADHLADGEESDTFRSQDTAREELGSADVLGLLDDGSWRLGNLGYRLEQGVSGGWVLDGLQGILVIALESGNGPVEISLERALYSRVNAVYNSRWCHLLALEYDLGELGADSGVVDSSRNSLCSQISASISLHDANAYSPSVIVTYSQQRQPVSPCGHRLYPTSWRFP